MHDVIKALEASRKLYGILEDTINGPCAAQAEEFDLTDHEAGMAVMIAVLRLTANVSKLCGVEPERVHEALHSAFVTENGPAEIGFAFISEPGEEPS
jgi:hypothetical protein